ncbi:hypothetical protein [Nonomuraea sp. NPDC050786]|uniref:hypothetical protein n=1 Tax=Nonomuraea sp. NPDC050786 TaxID=3154840 RepID=UPI00340095E2
MAFKTFVSEEVLASADVNTYLMKQAVIVCTSGTRPGSPNEGMTIYETDTDTYRGYDGAAWQEIFMLNPPRCHITRTSTQSIPDGVQTTVTWQSSSYNYRNMWSSGSNPSRITVPAGMGGLYHCAATLEYNNSTPGGGDGTRTVALLLNGSIVGRSIQQNTGTGQATRVFYVREIVASPGDYFEIAAYQNSGVSLPINVVQSTPFFQVRRVGPA